MLANTGIQILSFDNFGALETHIRILKSKYADMIKGYEETLGFILRDTRPSTTKSSQLQQKWSEEMQAALVGMQIVDGKRTDPTMVTIGKSVTLKDRASGEELRYNVVGGGYVSSGDSEISYRAPLAAGLIGRKAGDVVDLDNHRLVVEEVDGVRITRLRVIPLQPARAVDAPEDHD